MAGRDTFQSIRMWRVVCVSVAVERIRDPIPWMATMMTLETKAKATWTISGHSKMISSADSTTMALTSADTTTTGTRTEAYKVFNKGKIRELESQLAHCREEGEMVRREAASQVQALEATVKDVQGQLALMADTLVSLLSIVPGDAVRLREVITAQIPEIAPIEQLPQVRVGITIVDTKGNGVSKEIGELSQSLSYALGEFLRSPSVEKISQGIEAYQDLDSRQPVNRILRSFNFDNYTRTTHEIALTSPYLAELEVVTAAIFKLLENVFEKRSPRVTILHMEKTNNPVCKFRVQIGPDSPRLAAYQ